MSIGIFRKIGIFVFLTFAFGGVFIGGLQAQQDINGNQGNTGVQNQVPGTRFHSTSNDCNIECTASCPSGSNCGCGFDGSQGWYCYSSTISFTSYPDGRTSSGSDCDPATDLCNPLQSDSFLDLINRLIDYATYFSGVVLVAIIMWAAVTISVSGSNPEKVNKARDMIKWGIIGFILVTSSNVILSIVVGLF